MRAQHSKRYSATNTAVEGSSAKVQDRSEQHSKQEYGCRAKTSNSTTEGWFPTSVACSFGIECVTSFAASTIRLNDEREEYRPETVGDVAKPDATTSRQYATRSRRGYDEHSRQNRYRSKR